MFISEKGRVILIRPVGQGEISLSGGSTSCIGHPDTALTYPRHRTTQASVRVSIHHGDAVRKNVRDGCRLTSNRRIIFLTRASGL